MSQAPSSRSTTSRRQEGRHSIERPATEDLILAAANACFERSGIRGTTIDDIAGRAKVSRATLYRYFSNKEAIVDRISANETERVNVELRRKLTAGASTVDTIVECLFLATQIAHKNPCVRAFVEEPYVASRTADPGSVQHGIYRASWGKLIERGLSEKAFAADLTIDSIMSWLLLSLNMLLIKVDAVEISDAQLRHFIRRFVITPLLHQ